MMRHADRDRRGARIIVIGPMPPPVHGYSVVTDFVVRKLGEIAEVDVVDTAPERSRRDIGYHVQRVMRASRALWHLVRGRSTSRTLYMAIAGGAGVAYDLPLALAARLLGYRIYLHHHSFNYINRRRGRTALLIALAGSGAAHICLSPQMARRLTALYPRAERTMVLSNAALTHPLEKTPARGGPVRLGFLSNLIPEKGIDRAIEVTRLLRADKRDVVLAVAGPALTPDTQRMLARAKDELGTAFEYRGAVYGAQKAAFFASLDVFLFPSRYANEAQPLVVLEALAAGVPVLATQRGCMAEDIGSNGGAFRDADYVGEAVQRVAQWCEERHRLAALSAATTGGAARAHASATSQLHALLHAMAGSRADAPSPEWSMQGATTAMRLAVAIATRGRGDMLVHLLNRLKLQTRAPDIVCVSGVEESDVTAARTATGLPLRIAFGPGGLTAQRNTAVRDVLDDADAIVFFDDDFLPARSWLERAEQILSRHPRVVGIDGHTLADGADGAGIAIAAAERLLDAADSSVDARDCKAEPTGSLYGCNMAFRASVFKRLAFDEQLPLYGWLEDHDFSCRARALGPLVSSAALRGVHLGLKSGKTSGVKFGISQMINPIHLWRKGATSGTDAARLLLSPLVSNLFKAVSPEPYVDRRGRLRGNLMGLGYLLTGRADPMIVTRIN
jgi:glycosyltransferase involved in cell wall biosynthesis/GT2 family glycosyltransferase